MLEESTSHSHELIIAAQELLSEHFQTPVHFSKAAQLSELGRRNLILRLTIDNPTSGMPETVIMKKTVTDKGLFDNKEGETEVDQLSRFAHDWAGLEFLTQVGGHHAPRFYAGNREQKFILFEDLGVIHPSLVDPLTRVYSPNNLQEAEQALLSYMQRLGKMHADTAAKSQEFTSNLNRIYLEANRIYLPNPEIVSVMGQFKLMNQDQLPELGREVNEVLEQSVALNEYNVLLHGDICPDNVYFQNNETRFIDFEFSDFGNALIDAVYLRMQMPSCWCSKAIPKHIVDRMESAYRAELKKGIPSATDDTIFNKQLVYACAYWVIRTINQIKEMDLLDHEWVCPSGPVATDSRWEPEKNTFRPRILSRLESFILTSSETEYLPRLNEVSKRMLSHLKEIWPDTQYIDLFPVFLI